MLRRYALIAAIAVALAPASACSGRAASQTDSPASAPSATVRAAEITPMTLEERQRLIAPNFQVEVPVPSGEVVRGEAQGELAWDYELIVAAPPAAVATWYRETYTGRDWQVVDQTVPSKGAITLTMTKNGAQTRLVITPEGSNGSRVSAVLGVGTPVLQTQ